MIYILGINGFIGRNIYLFFKKLNYELRCVSHKQIDILRDCNNDDIIINCCGINRSHLYEEYYQGNYIFIKELLTIIQNKPFLIHISSLMVNNFTTDTHVVHQKDFIKTKMLGEKLLINDYDNNKLCIVRPSNIYGYDCEPYYNNILVTLVYEKIVDKRVTTNINKNCIRNFLSIKGLCSTISNIIKNKTVGVFDVLSNNYLNLEQLIMIIYNDNIPEYINILDNDISVLNISENDKIIIEEDIKDNILKLENSMINYNNLKSYLNFTPINIIKQERGNMAELSNLESKRLYYITINEGHSRGNHYHLKQIETFYTHKGCVIFTLSHINDIDTVLFKILDCDQSVTIKPLIIHTLTNDFIKNECEVFITSTQEYIKNSAPDTIYV